VNVLLHVCCGPCMTSFDKIFKDRGIPYSAYFYNPNIHPYQEYLRRRDTFRSYAEKCKVPAIIEESFMQHRWEEKYKGLDAAERCKKCYELRIGHTAQAASINKFTHFTTTLLISPYQNHEMICGICEKAAKENNVKFYYEDFRPLFREGQNEARKLELYRQKYCGCIYSYESSKFRDKISWD